MSAGGRTDNDVRCATLQIEEVDFVSRILDRVRERRPRVHCITNDVAASYTANCLLAVNALPSMTANEAEIEDFIGSAEGLLINLGTLDESRMRTIEIAVRCTATRQLPWCLDPVFVERSTLRLQFAKSLLGAQPTVVRGNAVELEALGITPFEHASGDLPCIAATGATDTVCKGARVCRIENGHHIMARVTATGCALGALVAAYSSVEPNSFYATVGALLTLGIAGEQAAVDCQGPGDFQNRLLDRLYHIKAADIVAGARVS